MQPAADDVSDDDDDDDEPVLSRPSGDVQLQASDDAAFGRGNTSQSVSNNARFKKLFTALPR